jgi:hypothetical protein
LKENNFSHRILYTTKLKFKIDGGIVFNDKQKLRQYMTTKSPLQKILKGILHMEMKTNIIKVFTLMRRRVAFSWLPTLKYLNNKNI